MSSISLCHGLVLKIHSVVETRNEKNSCSLHKIAQSSTDLQPCLQMSSISLCHGLVLKIHSVVEIQI